MVKIYSLFTMNSLQEIKYSSRILFNQFGIWNVSSLDENCIYLAILHFQVRLWLNEAGFPNPDKISLTDLEKALKQTGIETVQYSEHVEQDQKVKKISIWQFREIIENLKHQ
jgi:hypothetical protein